MSSSLAMRPKFKNIMSDKQQHIMETTKDIEEEFERIMQEASIYASSKCSKPMVIITVNDSVIATLGNFSLTTGKAKSKKTFNVSAMVSSALTNSKVLQYQSHLPEGKRRILYIDTEQSKFHCQKVLKRILKLSNLPEDLDCRNIDFICMREYSPRKRTDIVEHALSHREGYGLVIIDGIRDLMLDINNSAESVDLVNKLMRWSSLYMVHIHCVIHVNKGDDNVRGHLGTEMQNKAESVLQVEKSFICPDVSEVRVKYIRDREFDPFAFRINKEGLPELAEDYRFRTKSRWSNYKEIPDTMHHEVLEYVFRDGPIKGYQPLMEALKPAYKAIGYDRGDGMMNKVVKLLIEKNILEKQDRYYCYVCPPTNANITSRKEEEPC